MRSTNLPAEADLLKRVTVRLIDPHEREEFDRWLEADHYLGRCALYGPSLRYVAELDGQYVALIAFGVAALHLKARDRWIGWSPRQRARRLGLVANNSRFLVLPEREKLPNLASRVLGLVLRRLSDDWLKLHGKPILVVETFVDETLYRGTCYKACGFVAIGATAGFARSSRDFYTEHGKPKQLFVRELHPRGCALLRQARLPESLANYETTVAGPCPLQAHALGDLYQRFRQLGDPRRGHGLLHRHSFILATAAVCTLMGAGGFRDFEAVSRKFTNRQLKALGCRPDTQGRLRSPSDSTFRRVINDCDVRTFVRIVGQWMLEQEISAIARLALDGKTLRGSGRRDGKPLQIFSAVTHHLRLTLEQVPIEEKTNEIPNFIPLLKELDPPPGTLITADAMHCQQESARYVVQEMGGDYLFGLKGNQSGILDRAQRLLAQQAFPP